MVHGSVIVNKQLPRSKADRGDLGGPIAKARVAHVPRLAKALVPAILDPGLRPARELRDVVVHHARQMPRQPGDGIRGFRRPKPELFGESPSSARRRSSSTRLSPSTIRSLQSIRTATYQSARYAASDDPPIVRRVMSRIGALLPLLVAVIHRLCRATSRRPRSSPTTPPRRRMQPNSNQSASATTQSRRQPGVSVSVIARGLKSPRFMAFDAAGNLLVADAARATCTAIPPRGRCRPDAPPAPLISGLDAPQRRPARRLPVRRRDTAISRYAYDPVGGSSGTREVVVPDLPPAATARARSRSGLTA